MSVVVFYLKVDQWLAFYKPKVALGFNDSV